MKGMTMNRIYRIVPVFWLLFFICSVTVLKAAETKKEVSGNLVEQALQLKQAHPELFRGANGVVVAGIVPGSQGEKAGLQPGDILLSYDDVLLEDAAHIIKLTKERSSEECVVLGYLRRTTYQEAIIHGGRIGVKINNLIKSERELAFDRMNSLFKIGGALYDLSQYAIAVEYYEQALTISRSLGDKAGERRNLRNIGDAYSHLFQYAKALEHFEQALTISRSLGDKAGEGGDLSNIGYAYSHLSQYAKALEHLEQALTISRAVGDKAGESRDLSNVGYAYSDLSQYAKALEYYEQSLIISRSIGDKAGERLNLCNIGYAYSHLSQYAKALEYFEQSLTISRSIGDKTGERNMLCNIGIIYGGLSQYAKALEYSEQSLTISRAIGDKEGEGRDFINRGNAYVHLSQYAKALECFEQSLTISRSIGDRAKEGISLSGIGWVYENLNQYPEALEYRQKALKIDAKIGSPNKLLKDWYGIKNVYAKLNHPLAAIMAGKQAVNTLQSMRQTNKNLQKEFQRSFLDAKEYVYQELADLLIDQGRIPEAEQVMAMLKEEEFFDFIRRVSTDDPRKTRASYTKAEQKWLEGYQKISQNLMSLAGELETLEKKDQLEPAEQQRLTELETELEKAEDAFIGILDGLDEYFTKVAADKAMAHGNRNLDLLADQQAQLAELGHGAVLIHTVTTKEKLHLLLTTPDVSLARLSQISEPELNRLVKQFREVLQTPQADPLPLAQKLYDILVRPVEQDLVQYHAKTLMWSLDGTLRYIPIAALHDGKNYLIEKYPVVLYTAAANNKLLRDNNSEWQLAGLGVSKQYGDYSPLPAVPGELNGIVKKDESDNIGVIPGVVYLNEQFDQSHFKSVLKQGYPVLHIATHFSLKPGDSSASHLLLGDGNILSLEEFRMRRAYRMPKVDLLTLSACNTAMGDKGAGGEVESFGALAQKQGAAGVLATLWPVADASTGLFMQELYRLRGADNKMTKVEALALVQQNFIRSVLTAKDLNTRGLTTNKKAKSADLSYRHPYYWAPFILMGNWL